MKKIFILSTMLLSHNIIYNSDFEESPPQSPLSRSQSFEAFEIMKLELQILCIKIKILQQKRYQKHKDQILEEKQTLIDQILKTKDQLKNFTDEELIELLPILTEHNKKQ